MGALTSVAQFVGASSHNQTVARLTPDQGIYLGCGFDPHSGHRHRWPPPLGCWSPVQSRTGGNQLMPLDGIDVSLSPFLSLSKTNEKKKCSQVTIKKKKMTWECSFPQPSCLLQWSKSSPEDNSIQRLKVFLQSCEMMSITQIFTIRRHNVTKN